MYGTSTVKLDDKDISTK